MEWPYLPGFKRMPMKTLATTLTFLLLSALPGLAAGPIGEWLTEKGDARIRIENCGERLWGVVTWEREPGVDAKNPDPAKRGRPTLGLPIILGMTEAGEGRWKGGIYNAENGKIYAAEIKLQKANVLRVQGCVLAFLCGAENWTRFDVNANAKVDAKATAKANSKAKADISQPKDSAKQFCEALPEAARASHQGRLK
jgi:uncharacterized protein (DUF2147 family)